MGISLSIVGIGIATMYLMWNGDQARAANMEGDACER